MDSRGEKYRTFRIISLGCAKNLVDSEQIAGALLRNGWREAGEEENRCDILIVNTCAFIEDAQRESIEALQETLHMKHEGRCSFVVAAGCLVQDAGRELRKFFSDIDLLIGTDEIAEFLTHLLRIERGRNRIRLYRRRIHHGTHGELSFRTPLESKLSRYVKIADGCDTGCAFCVIPRIRGSQVSLQHENVIRECERLIASGARELILVSQDTTAYGTDRGEKDYLARLLNRLSHRFESEGEMWIRLFYLNPHKIDAGLIDAMSHPPILPYFDLAIQHASPVVLKAMSRPIPSGRNGNLIDLIRERIPHAALRATVMIGHPGEDRNAFDHLLAYIESARFDHVGVFTYSPQSGTKSAEHESPSKDEVENRLVEINSLITDLAENRFQEMRGKTYRFIWDDHASSLEEAPHVRSWMDGPDIDRLYTPENGIDISQSPFVWGTISGGDMIHPTVSIRS